MMTSSIAFERTLQRFLAMSESSVQVASAVASTKRLIGRLVDEALSPAIPLHTSRDRHPADDISASSGGLFFSDGCAKLAAVPGSRRAFLPHHDRTGAAVRAIKAYCSSPIVS